MGVCKTLVYLFLKGASHHNIINGTSYVVYLYLHTLWVEKLDPFSVEHNFGKCCSILIILLLLQTEINYDQVYPKVYHRISNLPV